jgi:flagellum-specific ATP synthase
VNRSSEASAAGEPPTARGYAPSVFAELPALCERCGTAPGGGSITALYTVLVEGDDFNEPVSDIVRATLDGHIMLSRDLAHEGYFPAIDVLQSVSRLASDLVEPAQRRVMQEAIDVLAVYARNREMVDMGAYRAGSNPVLDRALQVQPALKQLLRQSVHETSARSDTMERLCAALKGTPA